MLLLFRGVTVRFLGCAYMFSFVWLCATV